MRMRREWNLGLWGFQNGTKGAPPPIFLKECGSGLESACCGNMENGSVQAAERKGFAGGRTSKLVGKFTKQDNMKESTCQ